MVELCRPPRNLTLDDASIGVKGELMGLFCPYVPGRYSTFLRKIASFHLFGKVIMFSVSRYPRKGGLYDPMFPETGAYACDGHMSTQGHSMYVSNHQWVVTTSNIKSERDDTHINLEIHSRWLIASPG